MADIADITRVSTAADGTQGNEINHASVHSAYGEGIEYRSFNGDSYLMHPWVGRNVAVLTPIDPVEANADSSVMAELLVVFDAGYDWYAELTSREPARWGQFQVDGRATVAVVSTTCGAGCGYLGFTGIEIMYDWFGSNLRGPFEWVNGFYDTMLEDEAITSIVFYELGRNFWFYGEQLSGATSDWGLTTGYAVINRFLAGESTGRDWADGENEPYYFN